MSGKKILNTVRLAYQQLPAVLVLNLVLAAMQAVSTSGNLPIFGSQSLSPSHPSNSAADPIKDLTSRGAKKASSKINVDKQSRSHPECTKIKTEKALYMDTEVVVQMPAIKRKTKNVDAVVPVPEPPLCCWGLKKGVCSSRSSYNPRIVGNCDAI
ncbi:hypothetical protein L208DRAFT_1378589 [Tricholoma matsutake]|nr:hypothetical protein L208DRAFT_1378589 [Tricholoma matsutake 945]